jgi:uncharacterized membrane protein
MTRRGHIDHRVITASLAAAVLAIALSGPAAAASTTASRAVTVRCTEILKSGDVTNGGLSGTGHCTMTGAINDQGKATDYRKQIANTALVRRVVVARKGMIAFLIRISLGTGSEPSWSVQSGSGAYRGLHGKGREVVDNFSSTPATFVMKGTVGK